MVIGHDDYPFEIGAQDLICSHIGIFGNTGSGKSNTLAKLYNEIISKYEKYRSFKRNSKFVVFDFNGGTYDSTSSVTTYILENDAIGKYYVVKPSKDGYVFIGWGTSKTSTSVKKPGTSYTPDKTRTLYAIWK